MKTSNKIIDIQEIVYNQLKRLDNNDDMEVKAKEEIERANVISNNAQTFIKALNMQLSIMQYADKSERKVSYMYKKLGLSEDLEDEE